MLRLIDYASNNNGRYPWAVPLTDIVNYNDSANQLFGRIPDNLANTNTDSGNGMFNSWGGCTTHSLSSGSSNWWLNWREMVFYGLANAYKPVNPPSTPTTCPTCIIVNPPSALADKKIVVIVAGKMLPSQTSRATAKSTLSNYLEPPNSIGTTTFSQGPPSATFNDTVVFP